jgi:hypothetical protein
MFKADSDGWFARQRLDGTGLIVCPWNRRSWKEPLENKDAGPPRQRLGWRFIDQWGEGVAVIVPNAVNRETAVQTLAHAISTLEAIPWSRRKVKNELR